MSTGVFVLHRWTIANGVLEARFTEGSPEAPVVYINVEELENLPAVERYLSDLEPFNQAIHITEDGAGGVSIQAEYADQLVLRGKRVSLQRVGLEAADFERQAKHFELWGNSMHDALRTLSERVGDTKHLLLDQRRRLEEKVERREVDSTARLLYEQQISFIDRILSKLG